MHGVNVNCEGISSRHYLNLTEWVVIFRYRLSKRPSQLGSPLYIYNTFERYQLIGLGMLFGVFHQFQHQGDEDERKQVGDFAAIVERQL